MSLSHENIEFCREPDSDMIQNKKIPPGSNFYRDLSVQVQRHQASPGEFHVPAEPVAAQEQVGVSAALHLLPPVTLLLCTVLITDCVCEA